MQTTTNHRQPVPSPIDRLEILKQQAFNVRNPDHPARREMERFMGTHQLAIRVEEDVQTLGTLKQEGLIAFLATLVRNGEVIAQGRGAVVLSPTNQYMDRAIHTAFNSAVSDAVIRATKVLDTFSGIPMPKQRERRDMQKATEKQLTYLGELIRTKCVVQSHRKMLEDKLPTLSKDEASRMIEKLR